MSGRIEGSATTGTYNDAPLVLFAESTSTDNTYAITYDTTTPAICSVDSSSGSVTILGAGLCTITANSASTENYYAAAEVRHNITIAKAAQDLLTVTGGTTLTYGATLDLDTLGGSGTGDVSFAVTGGTASCSIDPATGVLSVDNANGGSTTCTVTATKAFDGNYNVTTSADFVVTVNRATDSITINPSLDDTALVFNNTRALSLSVGGAGTGAITWEIGVGGSATCTIGGPSNGTLAITDAMGGGTTCVIRNGHFWNQANNGYAPFISSTAPDTLTSSASLIVMLASSTVAAAASV
jgi:hypothetical protein